MNETPNAAFNFVDYKILSLSYTSPNGENEGLLIKFEPRGIYNEKQGQFELTLRFIGKETENSQPTIDLVSMAIFIFKPNLPFSNIPPFFYKNAIAIFFPYLRAFISTLTLQCNSKILLLNVMNLMNLEQPFREATTCISE